MPKKSNPDNFNYRDWLPYAEKLAKGMGYGTGSTLRLIEDIYNGLGSAIDKLKHKYGISALNLIRYGAEKNRYGKVSTAKKDLPRLRLALKNLIMDKFAGA